MDTINETQVLTNIRLSHAQKFVLAKLTLPNLTPLTAYEHISTGKNIVANRDILIKLGMVKVGQNEAEITEKGTQALQNENLIDDMGNLTEQGEGYAYAKDLVAIEKLAAKEKPPEVPEPEISDMEKPQVPVAAGASSPDAGVQDVSFESWSMISAMQEELSEKEFLKKKTSKK